MAIQCVGARLFAGREPVVELPPMIGTGVGRIDTELLDGIDGLEHPLDLDHPETRRKISPPGRT